MSAESLAVAAALIRALNGPTFKSERSSPPPSEVSAARRLLTVDDLFSHLGSFSAGGSCFA